MGKNGRHVASLRRYSAFVFYLLCVVAVSLSFSTVVSAQVLINEVDADTPGSDDMEFIELYDGGVGNTPLDGLVVVLFNGADDQSYRAFDLDGFSTDSDGFFVLGNAGVAGADLVIPNNSLQNGADAVALYTGDASDFPNDTPVTTTNLIDALVYDTSDPDDAGLLVLLNPGEPQINENAGGDAVLNSNQRFPNGSGGTRNTSTYTQLPPTPGAANVVVQWSLTTSVSPAGGGSVTRDPDKSAYDDGESVDLTATPNAGFEFVSWTGDLGGANSTDPSITVVMDQDRSLTAQFAAVKRTLAITVVPAGAGEVIVDPNKISFDDGESVQLTVAPHAGFFFDHWAGDIGTANTTAFSITLVMDQDRSVSAHFSSPAVPLLINELDADTPGTDDMEFIELYDGGAGHTSLDGLVLVLFNGSTDKSYRTFDLHGFSTGADGFFVLGNAGVQNVDLVFGKSTLQNGADAVALFLADAGNFPNGTPVTTINLVDALVYDTDDADDAGLLGLLNPGQPQVNENGGGDKDSHSNQRLPNGSGGGRNTATYVQLPPTPGAPNIAPPPPRTLTVSVTPSGSGTVSLNPDKSTYDDGETVELTAAPAAGFAFVRWSGDIGGAAADNPSMTVVMDQERTITAQFAAIQHSLAVSISPAGAGTVVVLPDKPAYDHGESVELTATASPGFVFDGWTGDLGGADATKGTLSLVMDRDRSVTAHFKRVATTVVINEIDADTPGSDDREFIELFDGGAGDTELDGLVLVLFNGSNDKSYRAFDLDGFETDATGFFVLGGAGVPDVDLVAGDNFLQNGPDAAALFVGNATDFPNGTPVTTADLIDAVVYGSDDSPDPGLLALLKSGELQLNENGRGQAANHSLQRIPNGAGGKRRTGAYLPLPPTPGKENFKPPEPDIAVSDTLVRFGHVEPGEAKDKKLMVKNEGDAALIIDKVKIRGADMDQFSAPDLALPVIVDPGRQEQIVLRFNPTLLGPKKAYVSLLSNDPDEGKVVVTLRGKGVGRPLVPQIAVQPERLLFRRVELGTERTLPVVVSNQGRADLHVQQLVLDGRNPGKFSIKGGTAPFVLSPGENREVEIGFLPRIVGVFRAELQIESDDPKNGLLTVPLHGSGFSTAEPLPPGTIVINEIHYNPGSQQGSDDAFEFLELFNTSEMELDLTDFRFTDGISLRFESATIPANGFLVLARDADTYPGSVQWGSGSLVNTGELVKLVDATGATVDSVVYGVTAPWPAAANGGGPSLELIDPALDNALPENWQASSVLGGTPGLPNSAPPLPPAEPDIAIAQHRIEFGEIAVGAAASREVTVFNEGGADLLISAMELADENGQFSIDSALTLPTTLAPGDSLSATLLFRPRRAGLDSSLVRISSNDPDEPVLELPVAGLGVAPGPSRFAGVLVINEIHYNPATRQGSDAEFEFVELHNLSQEDVSLEGFHFTAGIEQTFQPGDVLPAGAYLVLARNAATYPGSVQWDSGSLVNTGELLKLVDATGATVDSVVYGVTAPWPDAANGGGPSLELIDPALDNALPENWQASARPGGTPGLANSQPDSSQVGPDIAVAPAAVDFGVVNLHAEARARVTVWNAGAGTLEIERLHVAGRDSAQFRLLEEPTSLSLAAGDSAGFVLGAQATAPRRRWAALQIYCNDPDESPAQVALEMYVNSPPTVPRLVAPREGEAGDRLIWFHASDPDTGDATTYTVQLAREADFSSGVMEQRGVADTTLSLADFAANHAVQPGTFYYWRVKAEDEHVAASEFSLPGYFRYEASLPTAVGSEETKVPRAVALLQNYPNPFNPQTTIRFTLPGTAGVSLMVFDLRGRRVRTLLKQPRMAAGEHTAVWDGRDDTGRAVASGIYLSRLVAALPERTVVRTRKMVLVR